MQFTLDMFCVCYQGLSTVGLLKFKCMSSKSWQYGQIRILLSGCMHILEQNLHANHGLTSTGKAERLVLISIHHYLNNFQVQLSNHELN